MEEINLSSIQSTVLWATFAVGLAFGAISHRTHFCTMGAIADVFNFGDWNRMRMWLLAIAVAIAGTTLLAYTGQVDLSKSVPQRPAIAWLSLLVGGGVFGVGMTLAGGCANKNLLRLGGGSARVFRASYEPESKKLEWWLLVLTAGGVAAMLAPGLLVWADVVKVPGNAQVVGWIEGGVLVSEDPSAGGVVYRVDPASGRREIHPWTRQRFAGGGSHEIREA